MFSLPSRMLLYRSPFPGGTSASLATLLFDELPYGPFRLPTDCQVLSIPHSKRQEPNVGHSVPEISLFWGDKLAALPCSTRFRAPVS